MRSENFVIFILATLLFFHIVEFMIIMPLGPQFMRVYSIDAQQFGHLVSVYNISAAVSGVLGILWLDLFDRKRVLLTVLSLFILGTTFCALTTDFHTLMISRAVTGFFGGLINALCLTIVGDLVPMERRGFAMGKLMTAFSFAAIMGVPAGLMLSHLWGYSAPFLAIAGGASMAVAFAWLFLPPIRGHLHNPQHVTLKEILSIAFESEHLKAFIFVALMMMAQFSIIPYISTAMVLNAQLPEAQLPTVYFIGGLMTVVTTPLFGRLGDRLGKKLVYKVLAVLFIIPVVWVTNLNEAHGATIPIILCATTLFFVIISGRASPAQALISAVPPASQRGRFMSLSAAVQQASIGIATWISGLIITTQANGQLLHYDIAGYVACGISLLSIVILDRLKAGQLPESAR